MEKIINIGGMAAITIDENNRLKIVQFSPDDEFAQVLANSNLVNGQLQILHNASFDFVANKPRVKANSELIRKAAHGKLSRTRDRAFQLTLKCFASEAIDWQRAFLNETVDIMANLMGPKRMKSILNDIIVRL